MILASPKKKIELLEANVRLLKQKIESGMALRVDGVVPIAQTLKFGDI